MSDGTDALTEATTALVPALLTALDALAHVGRRLHPPNIPHLAADVQQWREPLAAGREAFKAVRWPDRLERFAAHCRGGFGPRAASL